MKNNTDKLYNKYKNLDFEKAKPISKIPALAKLQTESKTTTRITLQIDNEILKTIKQKAAINHKNYQTIINNVLKQFFTSLRLPT